MIYLQIKRICFYPAWLFALLCGLLEHPVASASDAEAVSDSAVYRCGAEYTNRPAPEKIASCERLDDSALSVVRIEGTSVYLGNGEGAGFTKHNQQPKDSPSKTRIAATAPSSAASTAKNTTATATSSQSANNPAKQKKRESDAVVILQAELQKTKLRRSDVEKEYAKTKDAKLKSELGRLAADEAGIARELSRMVN